MLGPATSTFSGTKSEFLHRETQKHAVGSFGYYFRATSRRNQDQDGVYATAQAFEYLLLPAHRILNEVQLLKVTDEYKELTAELCYSYFSTHRKLFWLPENNISLRRAERLHEQKLLKENWATWAKEADIEVPKRCKAARTWDLKHQGEFSQARFALARKLGFIDNVPEEAMPLITEIMTSFFCTGNMHAVPTFLDWGENPWGRTIAKISRDQLVIFARSVANYLDNNSLRYGQAVIAADLRRFWAKELLNRLLKHDPNLDTVFFPQTMRDRAESGLANRSDLDVLLRAYMARHYEEDVEIVVRRPVQSTIKASGFEFSDETDPVARFERVLGNLPFGMELEHIDLAYLDVAEPISSRMLSRNHNIRLAAVFAGGFYRPFRQDIRILRRRNLDDDDLAWLYTPEHIFMHELVHRIIGELLKKDKHFYATAYRRLIRDQKSIYALLGAEKYPSGNSITAKSYVQEELAMLWQLMQDPSMRERIRNELPEHYEYAVEVMKATP